MIPGAVDLVLTGGLCVTCDEAGTVTNGDVYVDGGRIVAIGGPARGARRSVDASGTIVLPGLVNLHDHLRDMTPGLDAGEGLKLDQLLRFYWRLNEVAGAVEYETMAAYSTARLLASGVTTVVDPDILGGVVTRIGSTVYDGSVARHLERMRQTLLDR